MSVWEVKTLADSCDMYQPKTISKKQMVENGKYSVFGANGIIGQFDQYNHEDAQLLITCRGATCGSVNVSEPYSWINGNAMVVRPKDEYINLDFLTYLFRGGIDLSEVITGAAQPQITRQSLNSIQIPVPPLAEQERIVAILDEAFEGLATATAHTQQKLQNAQELFQSTLQSTFQQKGKDWTETTLSDLTESISDGDHSAPPKSSEGIPFITISNINKSTLEIDFSKTFKVPKSYYDALNTKRRPQTGDVLYTVTGSFGIPVIVTSDNEFCFQRHIGILRPNKNTNSRLLYYLMMSPVVYDQAYQGATGTAQKTVSLTLLRAMRVPSIPLPEQKSIVKKLDGLSAATRELEALYQSQLTAYTELKQSLLHQAFSGKL